MRKIAALAWLVLAPGIASAQARGASAQARGASAQARGANGVLEAFTGPSVGPEAGLHDHRIILETTDIETSDVTRSVYGKTGFGAGGFAGYDVAVARRLRLGVEARASVGGGDGARATFFNGATYEARPRYGFGLSARAGYVVGDRTMVYGTVGYGDYRYRQRIGVFIDGATDRVESVTAGGGVEYRLNRRVGVRLDARHLFDRVTTVLVGVPIRF